jgi:hypothetical protein
VCVNFGIILGLFLILRGITMRKAMSIKVGDVMRSNSCNDFTVISIDNHKSVLVEFNDEFKYQSTSDAYTVKKGRIKNPYFGRLFGVGYLGVGTYQSRLGPASKGYANTQEYMSWVNMLSRCYYDKYIGRFKGGTSYDCVTVEVSWHNFQTFAEWFCDERGRVTAILPNVDFELDKDILSPLTKVYGSSTCSLVPVEINRAIKDSISRVRDNKLSTLKINKRNKYSLMFHVASKCISIENAVTAKECVEFYLKYKEGHVHDLALKYKSVLTPEVYSALISYELPKRNALLNMASTI